MAGSERATRLLHDARLALGEGDVPLALLLDVLDRDLPPRLVLVSAVGAHAPSVVLPRRGHTPAAVSLLLRRAAQVAHRLALARAALDRAVVVVRHVVLVESAIAFVGVERDKAAAASASCGMREGERARPDAGARPARAAPARRTAPRASHAHRARREGYAARDVGPSWPSWRRPESEGGRVKRGRVVQVCDVDVGLRVEAELGLVVRVASGPTGRRGEGRCWTRRRREDVGRDGVIHVDRRGHGRCVCVVDGVDAVGLS